MRRVTALFDRFAETEDAHRNLSTSARVPRTRYLETLAVVAGFGLVLYFMTRPAFDGFFFGEDFITRSLYLAANGDFLRAIFTPFGPFFRPTAVAWSIGTQLFLPWDPVIHHWRNLAFELLNLVLLYRIMLRMTGSFLPRVLGMALFVVSKVHLTIIGYINCIDNIGTLFYLLATVLFALRFYQDHRKRDYALAILFFGLGMFARDSSFVFFAVILVMQLFHGLEQSKAQRSWTAEARQLLPFGAVVLVYVLVRLAVLGTPPIGSSAYQAYTVRLDPNWMATTGVAFVGNLLNLSFLEPMVSGLGDLSYVFTARPGVRRAYGIAFTVLGVLLLLWTLAAGLRARTWISFCLVWAAVFIGPTLLIRNNQIYYIYEPVAAIALFVAAALDCKSLDRNKLAGLWAVLILGIGLNGWVHNQNVSSYAWRWVANQASTANREVFVPNQGRPVRSLTLVTDTLEQANFVRYLLDPPMTPSGSNQAMLKALLSPQVSKYRTMVNDSSVENVLRDAGPYDLIYRRRDSGEYARILPTAKSDACIAFEDQEAGVRATWVLSTTTRFQINGDATYVSDGAHSLQVSVQADGHASSHYGGVEIPISASDVALDLWIDEPENIKTIFVYESDAQGVPVYAWVANNPDKSLVAKRQAGLVFRVGADDHHGFLWSPTNRTGSPRTMQFFVDVKEGRSVTYYLDSVCALKN